MVHQIPRSKSGVDWTKNSPPKPAINPKSIEISAKFILSQSQRPSGLSQPKGPCYWPKIIRRACSARAAQTSLLFLPLPFPCPLPSLILRGGARVFVCRLAGAAKGSAGASASDQNKCHRRERAGLLGFGVPSDRTTTSARTSASSSLLLPPTEDATPTVEVPLPPPAFPCSACSAFLNLRDARNKHYRKKTHPQAPIRQRAAASFVREGHEEATRPSAHGSSP